MTFIHVLCTDCLLLLLLLLTVELIKSINQKNSIDQLTTQYKVVITAGVARLESGEKPRHDSKIEPSYTRAPALTN